MQINILTLDTINETAAAIIKHANGRMIWTFKGEMGSGKTTLIKAICKLLGTNDDICSPTFSLVNEYLLYEKHDIPSNKVFHFDFYRINNLNEVYDIGYEDYFYSGNICMIEWPEKIAELLVEENVFEIKIEIVNSIRQIHFN